MFTGLIESLGRVAAIDVRQADCKLRIECQLTGLLKGESIAVNGVCLTARDIPGDAFCADVSAETLSATNLGALQGGDAVNLERALMPSTRMGGHMVSGHVDGIGVCTAIEARGQALRFSFAVPATLSRYIVRKGSICVDGVSLTVNGIEGERFDVMIIPHTRDHTTFQHLACGDRVNIEVDLIARYLERLLQQGRAGQDGADDGPPDVNRP